MCKSGGRAKGAGCDCLACLRASWLESSGRLPEADPAIRMDGPSRRKRGALLCSPAIAPDLSAKSLTDEAPATSLPVSIAAVRWPKHLAMPTKVARRRRLISLQRSRGSESPLSISRGSKAQL